MEQQNFNISQESFTPAAWEAFSIARQLMVSYNHQNMDVTHIMLGLLRVKNGLEAALEEVTIDIERFENTLEAELRQMPRTDKVQAAQQAGFTIMPSVQVMFTAADAERGRLDEKQVSTVHMFIAALETASGNFLEILKKFNIQGLHLTKDSIYSNLKTDESGEERKVGAGGREYNPEGGKHDALSKYGVDLTELAREEKLDPVVGRNREVAKLMHILTRRTKNNPVLVGDTGVGKTAVVEGLAQRIVDGDVPDLLRNRRVINLHLGTLIAGTSLRGEFEGRLQSIIDEVKESKGSVMLFLDEIHTLVGAGSSGGALDASNIMKPALARGELQTIGATTFAEYRKYIESDAALDRRFSPVMVDEPHPDVAYKMLKVLKPRYEKHHGLKLTDEAMQAAVDLSTRYITDRYLPDKAIDLIDEALAKRRVDNDAKPPSLREIDAKLNNLKDEIESADARKDYQRSALLKVDREQLLESSRAQSEEWYMHNMPSDEIVPKDIAEIISERTKIPTSQLVENSAERLRHLEDRLRDRVIGQDKAVELLANAVRRAYTGLEDPHKPLGSFLFVGPTGVGKTELSKALAALVFDDEENMIRVDMTEYSMPGSVTRMIGSPPGYIGYDAGGGQLTEKVRRRPFSVILFDEIEKAHPDAFEILLQVLDDGRLTDGHGRTVDFKNTIIVMTSNTGTSEVSTENVGFRPEGEIDQSELAATYNQALKRHFTPEFLNRLDEIVVFNALSKDEILKIVDKLVAELGVRLTKKGIAIRLTAAAKEWLVAGGYDPAYGARPLKREIQRHIENGIASLILSGEVADNTTVVVDTDGGKLSLTAAATKSEKSLARGKKGKLARGRS